ncbi:MAG: 3-dehydroquinate synthase [Abditibacteriota bacterium]|nr:3-dehydroquinate synthase [Abditibacteriota bacterium]
MKTIEVKTQKPYNIYFCNNPFDQIEKDFPGINKFFITDKNVYSLYKKILPKNTFLINPGEENKNLQTFEYLTNELLKNNIHRDNMIVAFGGGVVGDMAGFVASTILRGIDFIQIPTTLLAMTDSSIGGKTGIDTEQGKNLIGSFWQPKSVYINPTFLKTLPEKEYRNGMAEVIKYSLISNLNLSGNEENIIYNSCKIKADIVSKDEREKGIRKVLNFGHTIGHVIEKYYNYSKFSHGEAVAIGMITMTSVGDKIQHNVKLCEYVKELLIKHSLPYSLPDIPKEDFINILNKDKKAGNKYIDCVMLKGIGDWFIHSFTAEELYNIINK